MMLIDLCERGLIPDVITRAGMRRLVAERLALESADRGIAEAEQFHRRLAELRASPVAIETDKANEQHYEVPAAFFRQVLGTHLKYSCCWYGEGIQDLDAAEAAMLKLSCERAELADGQHILELGCGWGSLTLWMATYYPRSRITAVSNSASQREFILGQARERGLSNVAVITADANDFSTGGALDSGCVRRDNGTHAQLRDADGHCQGCNPAATVRAYLLPSHADVSLHHRRQL
jgi:cyclopropane-fatty-acyl-phospholipid synthase